MSIVLADGAYQISGLQAEQRELLRQEHALTESLQVWSSTQNLAANAEGLGMVASGNPVFLDLATGQVSGTGTAAGGSLIGSQGNLIGNSLLDPSMVIDPTPDGDRRRGTGHRVDGPDHAPRPHRRHRACCPLRPPADHSRAKGTHVINPRGTRRRLALSVLVVFAIVSVFLVRLIDIQVVRADELRKSADERRTSTVTTYGARGSIVDANGTVLASSVDRFDITAAPRLVDPLGFTRTETIDGEKVSTKVTLPEAIAEISAITGVDSTTLLTALTEDPESKFTYLAKAVKLDVFNQVKALRIPWVYSEPHPSRSYPNGAIAGNLVGFVGTDGPQAGIEATQGACLDETNGTSRYEMSADGVRMPGSEVIEEEPTDGGTVLLTIDSDLNWFVQQVARRAGDRARSGLGDRDGRAGQ